MSEKGSRTMEDGAAKTYMVLEYAALRLARNEPLFSEIPAMEQYNREFRKELIYALCDALRALEQTGSAGERTAVSERVLSPYTSR